MHSKICMLIMLLHLSCACAEEMQREQRQKEEERKKARQHLQGLSEWQTVVLSYNYKTVQKYIAQMFKLVHVSCVYGWVGGMSGESSTLAPACLFSGTSVLL